MQDFRNRLLIATVILGLAFLVLGSRLWYLQVLRGDEFAEFSLDNHIRVERIPAPRGRILDRYGKELVVNRTSFDVYVIPKDINDIAHLSSYLSQILNLDKNHIDNNIRSALTKRSFKPVLIAKDINRDQLAFIEARRSSLPGVIIEINNLRQYPHGSLGAPFLGYIGKVSEAELKINPKINNNDLVVVDEVGPFELDGKIWADSITKQIMGGSSPLLWVVRRQLVGKVIGKWKLTDPVILDIAQYTVIQGLKSILLPLKSR